MDTLESVEGARHPDSGRNTALFDLIADVIEKTPQRYDQGVWGGFAPTLEQEMDFAEQFPDDPNGDENDPRWAKAKGCNTTFCIAGHAANLSGYYPAVSHSGLELDWGLVSKQPLAAYSESRGVATVAAELLGLTEEEADIIFDASCITSPGELRAIGRGAEIVHLDDED